MDHSKFELIIRQGRRPLWKIVFSAICFTLMLYALFDAVAPVIVEHSEENYTSLAKSLYYIALMFSLGVYNAMETDILIDTDKDLLITRYRLGPIKVDRKSTVPELAYVSVFKNVKDEFQVNLWYERNRHFKMYLFENRDDAFFLADKVAQRLNLDILDSTVRGQKTWIERRPADA